MWTGEKSVTPASRGPLTSPGASLPYKDKSVVSSCYWSAVVTSFLLGSAVAQQLSSLAASQRDTPPHRDFTSPATGKHTWVPGDTDAFILNGCENDRRLGEPRLK